MEETGAATFGDPRFVDEFGPGTHFILSRVDDEVNAATGQRVKLLPNRGSSPV